MPKNESFDAHQKALSLNLDGTIFGTFAEIGAGQEVARWFLRVGGASGTVAKTISAYDKEISDDLYGAGTRYVSKPRLQAMLESEWEQLLAQLGNVASPCSINLVADFLVISRNRLRNSAGRGAHKQKPARHLLSRADLGK